MEKTTIEDINTVLSTVLNSDEIAEVREMAGKLGVSASHLGRALVRLSLQSIKAVKDEAQNEMMLRLIKLGK